MTRDEAWGIVCEFVKSDSLRRHMLGVEACMVAYAKKYEQDEDLWAVTALLHDFDWEIHPAAPDHPVKGEPILEKRGVNEEVRRAILSHANYSDVPRQSLLACDELSGFLTACAYVKPGKTIFEVDVSSVKRKLKDKAFARSISRQDITDGATEGAVSLDDHIAFCIEAMKSRAGQLGLSPSEANEAS